MANEPKATDSYSEPAKRPSKAWYLVPIFFGIIGGLVMFLVLKDQDRKMAKKGLVLGIILTAVAFVVGIIIGALMALLSLSPTLPLKLSASECQRLLASLTKSGYPSTDTQQLMAKYGCS